MVLDLEDGVEKVHETHCRLWDPSTQACVGSGVAVGK